jgi:hypothetical protein
MGAVPSNERNGFTDFRHTRKDWLDPAVPLTRHGRQWLWDFTLIAIAGYLTQRDRYPETPEGSLGPDIRNAQALALRACENDEARAIAYVTKAAERLSLYTEQSIYWTLIDALAQALTKHGILTGSQVRDILVAATKSYSVKSGRLRQLG